MVMEGNIHFIAGSDDFLVEEEARRVFHSLCEGIPDDGMSREVIKAFASRSDDVVESMALFREAVQTMGMFSEEKVVWLQGVNFLADGMVGKTQAAEKAAGDLLQILEQGPPEGTRVLISACPIDRRKAFHKKAQANPVYRFLDAGNDRIIQDFIGARLKALGMGITPEAALLLQEKVGGNLRLLTVELEKCQAYLVGSDSPKLTVEVVQELVPEVQGEFSSEAVDAFFGQDPRYALECLRRFFFNGFDWRPLLTMLQKRGRLLIQMRALLDSEPDLVRGRWSKQSLEGLSAKYASSQGSGDKSDFNLLSQNPFYLQKFLLPQASRLSLRWLLECQEGFLTLFRDLIYKGGEPFDTVANFYAEAFVSRKK